MLKRPTWRPCLRRLLSSAMPPTPSKRVSISATRVDSLAVTGYSRNVSEGKIRTDPAGVNRRHCEAPSRPDSLPKLHVQLQR